MQLGSRQVLSSVALAVLLATPPDVCAQAPAQQRDGPVFVYGGLLVTSIQHDRQDTGSGYLHENFIGELDWPAKGLLIGGGAFVRPRLALGGELAIREAMESAISIQSHGHSDSQELSGLYTSHEWLLSFIARYDPLPRSPLDIQPLGGVTFSSATRALTEQRGWSHYGNYPPYPISNPDVTVDENALGLVGGADIAVRLGRGTSLIAAPRVHWIHREKIDEYDHVVPNAGRWVTSIAFGLQWRPSR